MITRWNLTHSHTRAMEYFGAELFKTYRNTFSSLTLMHTISMPMLLIDPLKLKPNKCCCTQYAKYTNKKKTEIDDQIHMINIFCF